MKRAFRQNCEERAPAALCYGRPHVKMCSCCSGLWCFVPIHRPPACRGDHSGGSARQIGQQLPFPTTGPPPMKRCLRATPWEVFFFYPAPFCPSGTSAVKLVMLDRDRSLYCAQAPTYFALDLQVHCANMCLQVAGRPKRHAFAVAAGVVSRAPSRCASLGCSSSDRRRRGSRGTRARAASSAPS